MILRYPHKKLRQKTKPVIKITPEIQKICQKMISQTKKASGAGLAANQIGQLKRIICYSEEGKYKILINPEIIKESRQKAEAEEGCLSFPNLFGRVERPAKVKVKGQNQFGKKQTIKAENMLAIVLQHEIDHLDGILFIDKADPDTLQEIEPKKAIQAVELKNDKSQTY